VEDDPAVRSGMLEILRRHQYNVLEAQDGVDALAVCERAGQQIHLLVTDIVMPRMNGRVLNQRLKALYPDMKALFVSGYTETTVINEVLTEDGVAYLPKPVTPEELARKVRDVLERPGPQR